MITLLVITGLLLISAVFVLLFRTQVLINVMKGSYNNKIDSSNKVHGILFIIFMAIFFVGMFAYNQIAKKHYLPVAASEHGVETDSLFWISMIIIIIAFLITNALLFIFPYKYAHDEKRRGYYYPDNQLLERIWTIVPAIVLVILLFSGLKLWTNITSEAPANAEVIEIMGKQFAWQVRYPGKDGKLAGYNFKRIDANNEFGILVEDQNSHDDFIPRELHIPKGKPVHLKIRARDVIHSVFLPHFRVKMDAVPGMQTNFVFVPTMTTAEMRKETGKPNFNYELACTEVCGRGHFAMRMLVVVDEPADYAKWVASQQSWKSQNEDYFAASLKKHSKGPNTGTKPVKHELSSL